MEQGEVGKKNKVAASCAILRLLWWEHTQVKAVMDGPVQKRDAVSRNIQRSVAVQTQQSKLTHPVNKALHHTCVNCSGLD